MARYRDGNGRPSVGPVNVPILGQPFDIKAWQLTVMLVCKCEPPGHLLLVTNGGFVGCPHCRKGYTIKGVTVVPGKEPHFNIGVAIRQPSPASPEP